WPTRPGARPRSSRPKTRRAGRSTGPPDSPPRPSHHGDGRDQVGVAQLAKRLPFDQTHPLSRQPEYLPGLAQRERLAVLQAVAERDHVALALVEHALDRVADLLPQQGVLHLVEGRVGVDLLDQVAELRVLT